MTSFYQDWYFSFNQDWKPKARRVDEVEETCVLFNVFTFVRRRRPCPFFSGGYSKSGKDGSGYGGKSGRGIWFFLSQRRRRQYVGEVRVLAFATLLSEESDLVTISDDAGISRRNPYYLDSQTRSHHLVCGTKAIRLNERPSNNCR